MGEAVWDRKAIMRGVHGETAIVLLGALEFAEARIAELERQIQIQKNAARTIMHHEGDELKRLREKAREHHVAIETLDSERAANARLTDELSAAETRLAGAVEALRPFADEFRDRREAYIRRYPRNPGVGAHNFDSMPDNWEMENSTFSMGIYRRAARFIQETERGDHLKDIHNEA